MKDEIDKLMESQSKEVKLVLAPNLRREGTCLRRIGAGTGAILKSSLGAAVYVLSALCTCAA
jgi:hypothetical protein